MSFPRKHPTAAFYKLCCKLLGFTLFSTPLTFQYVWQASEVCQNWFVGSVGFINLLNRIHFSYLLVKHHLAFTYGHKKEKPLLFFIDWDRNLKPRQQRYIDLLLIAIKSTGLHYSRENVRGFSWHADHSSQLQWWQLHGDFSVRTQYPPAHIS